MRLRACPVCRIKVTADPDGCPACRGIARLQKPSATWSGGVVIPIKPFLNLPRKGRRALAQQIVRALSPRR